MSTLIEMTAEIVRAHASASKLTSEELLGDLEKVYTALQRLELGQTAESAEQARPVLTVKQAFRKNEVICMVCGKGGMKTLARHLKTSHDLRPGPYRKMFGIPRSQSLSATSLSESRRAVALEHGLADNLAKAREVRVANIRTRKHELEVPVIPIASDFQGEGEASGLGVAG